MSVSEDGHWLYGIKECSSRMAPGWFAILCKTAVNHKFKIKQLCFKHYTIIK